MECQEKVMKTYLNQTGFLAPTFFNHYILPCVNFNIHCLINNNIFILKKIINLCFSILNRWLRDLNIDFKLNNCFFGFLELTINAHPEKYKYSG